MSALVSGNHGAGDRKQLRMLLPFTCDKLLIPNELADDIGATEALVISPSGKVWTVAVERDGDGAFLGRGWPQFAVACGVGGGWLLVLRHRGRGVLTVKVFDDTSCLRQLGTPTPPPAACDPTVAPLSEEFHLTDDGVSVLVSLHASALSLTNIEQQPFDNVVDPSPSDVEQALPVGAKMSWKDASRRPQFISFLPSDSMDKMVIPPEFVLRYMPKQKLDNDVAVFWGPLDKVWQIGLKMNQSGLFFADRWAQFLEFHGITKDNALLLRYEGNTVFTVNVFEHDGSQRKFKHKDIRMQQSDQMIIPDIGRQQEAPSASLNKASKVRSNYDIGPPAWVKKKMNNCSIENHLSLPPVFCDTIGIRESCTVTLKTSMSSTRS
ncbi:hypothetical protein QOZ80_4AG0322220 [Eleusine coracana subsp. coracana]|nr:hypothetical protein QOZ80_4AG0322220 [Eleusine coracana subsp. coracana]